MNHRRVHLLIGGRVQGVSFRAHAVDEAQRLGLLGWVRNLATGEVESIAEGPADQLETFVRWCHVGPEEAKVAKVGVEWHTPTREFASFGVRR